MSQSQETDTGVQARMSERATNSKGDCSSTEVTEQQLIASLRAQLADARNTIATYQQKLQTADGKIAQLLDATKQHKAVICRLQADLVDAQTKNNALTTEHQELKRDNKRLTMRAENDQRSLDRERLKSQQDLRDKRTEIFELTQDREALLAMVHPLQLRALRDYLLSNYGSFCGDPDKNKALVSTCDELATRTTGDSRAIEARLLYVDLHVWCGSVANEDAGLRATTATKRHTLCARASWRWRS
jgi:DNA repair exonuclease SbcCD ATPase subunit